MEEFEDSFVCLFIEPHGIIRVSIKKVKCDELCVIRNRVDVNIECMLCSSFRTAIKLENENFVR